MTPEAARELAESWVTHMEAEHKSRGTVKTYMQGLEAYVRWCEREGLAVSLTPRPVEKFMAALFGGGAEAATVLSRQQGVRRFSAWLAAEDGRPDRLAGMKRPKLDDKIAPFVAADKMAALLATCRTRGFHDVRDRAIISLLAESMVRAAELLDMTRDGVNIRQRTAAVERGKGGKGRVVAYSAATARDLDRYIRARASHRLAGEPWLWLPVKRSHENRLTYGGLYTTLRRRALRADPPFRLHPHMLRATGAIEFRRKGGQVTSLMALGGWSDISMVQRYIRAAESQLAVDEAHRLFDGEVLSTCNIGMRCPLVTIPGPLGPAGTRWNP
jgi:integrase/recombinase XerD